MPHAELVNVFVDNFGENPLITEFANNVANFVVYGLGGLFRGLMERSYGRRGEFFPTSFYP